MDGALSVGDGGNDGAPATSARRGVAAIDLEISLQRLRGVAHVTFEPFPTAGASLRVAGLSIDAVYDEDGNAIEHVLASADFFAESTELRLALPPSTQPQRISIEYAFERRDRLDGLLRGGMTFTWPYFCDNLFPCHPEPSDGLRFTLEVADAPSGSVTISGAAPTVDAPPYMIGWATGTYVKTDLGRTRAGTELAVWQLGELTMGIPAGVAQLRAVFEYYETRLGPYPYGSSAGSVEVDWGPSGLGGMEHHPYWHVHTTSMPDPVVHAHEAAHGWFGNGVRIQCWEDLVLSEGVATYLAARALDSIDAGLGTQTWESYRATLQQVMASPNATHDVWPQSCGAIDVIGYGLAGQLVYMKGAFFLRALEQQIGTAAMDAGLSQFFSERVGTAARFQDLIDTLHAVGGYDPNACARDWLTRDTIPTLERCP